MAHDDLDGFARAVEDNWCEAWMSLGRLHAQPPTHADAPSQFVRVWTPGVPEMLLNIVLRYRSPISVGVPEIERVIEPFRAHHLPFQWWLTRGTEPSGLREALRHIGMQTWGGATSMALPLAGWTSMPASLMPGTSTGTARSAADASEALGVICRVFTVSPEPMARWTSENPAFQLYVAKVEGRVASALATLRRGAVVGFYHVATVAWARRRGLAGALLSHALTEARDAGCSLATLTATPEARHLYEQLGFRACGMIEQWIPGPDLSWQLMSGHEC